MCHGAFTTVNGQKCVMDEGDLILTPQLAWHDHNGGDDQPIIWLDGLDFPLIRALHQLVFESYDKETQPIKYNSDQVSPIYSGTTPTGSPPPAFFHYKWCETNQALRALVESGEGLDPFDGTSLEFRNPVTGGSTMPTVQCALQFLQPGHKTDVHQHTSTVIYYAFRGSGTTLIGEKVFDWKQGDIFIVPLWYTHGHTNRSSSEEALLFSISDAPVLKSLNLLREERVNL